MSNNRHRIGVSALGRVLGIGLILGAAVSICGCRKEQERLPVGTPAAQKAIPAAPFRLVDVAAPSGLTFKHTHGTTSPITIVETMGSGCAFLDFDNDGWQDVFLVNSGENFRAVKQPSRSRLFRNTGRGSFEDVTERSGIVVDSFGMGCCAGDYDNDGRVDLFVTGYGKNFLFRNLGNGSFEDVTQRAGILKRPQAWGTGCAFVDLNRDGALDLYVANYVKYDDSIPLCPSGSIMTGCTPHQYRTQANELYMNQGNGRFTEEAVARGADDPAGAGLGVLVSDFDRDGWADIFVANDGTPNALLHNLGNGRLRNIGDETGVAFAENGVMRAGMGCDGGDYDGDGLFDLIITNFQHEPNSLYRNRKATFDETTFPSGIGPASIPRLGFGVCFVDLDRDGTTDLYVGNGHVFDNVTQFDDSATFEQTDQVFLNRGGGRLEERSCGLTASVARGVAVGDFNNDGAPDVLVNNLGRTVRLLENQPAKPASWLGIKLKGTRSNRAGIGARIELRQGGKVQVREVRSGGSYISQSDFRALFGLGESSDPGSVELRISWPAGGEQTVRPQALNRYLEIMEPAAGTAAREGKQ